MVWITAHFFSIQLVIYPAQIQHIQPETSQIAILHIPAKDFKVLIQRGYNLTGIEFPTGVSRPLLVERDLWHHVNFPDYAFASGA